jgi:flagellar operon protein
VDVKKVSNFESLMKTGQVGGSNQISKGVETSLKGPSFADTLNSVQGAVPGGPTALQGKAGEISGLSGVKFSNHAVERMQTRGISYNKADLERLNEAVTKAANKGSKDTLVLMNDSALIVSVKNKTVVTVMDKAALKENVFTNIDSTIVM